MTELGLETGKFISEKEIATKLQELMMLFDNFPEEGVPVSTDVSGVWPPQYDNLQNYDKVATNVMVALQYVDSIVDHISSPTLIQRVGAVRKQFYVSQDPPFASAPRMTYTSKDIAILKGLLMDIEKDISAS